MASIKDEGNTLIKNNSAKQPWKPMKLVYVGHISKLIQVGMTKIPITLTDPGEPRKLMASG